MNRNERRICTGTMALWGLCQAADEGALHCATGRALDAVNALSGIIDARELTREVIMPVVDGITRGEIRADGADWGEPQPRLLDEIANAAMGWR